MKNIYIILSLLTITVSVRAQQNTTELKQLINSSFNYFPKFKELGEQIKEGENRVLIAKASTLPVISAQGSYRYADPVSKINIPTSGGTASFQIMPNNNYSTMLNASYTLWDFGASKAAVDAAKYGLSSANHNLELQKSEMAFQVASIYYQIAYIKGAIDIQDSVISFLEDNKKDTEVKLKNGDALRYDVLSIQSVIDQENNRKITLKNSLAKQLALLAYTTGKETDIASSKFDFPAVNQSNPDQALENAKNNNSEFEMINDRIKQAEVQIKFSQSKGKPSLTLNAGTGYANGYAPDISEFRYNYNAGATLRIPIYEGGRSRAEISMAKNTFEESKYAKISLENTFLKDIRQALADIESNKSSLINSRQQAEQSREAQKLAQSRYKNGIGTYLELTNASTNVQRSELTNLQYEYELCAAQLNLARLTGLKYWL